MHSLFAKINAIFEQMPGELMVHTRVANCGVEGTHDRLITSYLNYIYDDSGLVEKVCLFTFTVFLDST